MTQTEIYKLDVGYKVKTPQASRNIVCTYYYSRLEAQDTHVRWLLSERTRQTLAGETRNNEVVGIMISKSENQQNLLSRLKQSKLKPLTTFAHGTKKDEIPDGYVSMV